MLEIVIIAVAAAALGLAIAKGLAAGIVALAPDDLPTDRRRRRSTAGGAVHVRDGARGGAAHGRDSAAARRRREPGAGARWLADDRRAPRARHARSSLVVIQIGLAVVLLVATGLVVRSFIVLRQIDLGFAPDHVLTAIVRPRSIQGPPNRWMNDLLGRARALPGVESAGAVYLRPLMLGPIGQGVRVFLEGQPETPAAASANPTLNHQIATPGYFETMKIPLARGRFFTDAGHARRAARRDRQRGDRTTAVARRGSDRQEDDDGDLHAGRTATRVAHRRRRRARREVSRPRRSAARRLRSGAPGRPDRRQRRAPHDRRSDGRRHALRHLARELDPRAIVDQVTSMDAVVRRAQAPWRLTTWMFVLFGVLAFGLAALGLFSLVALDVAAARPGVRGPAGARRVARRHPAGRPRAGGPLGRSPAFPSACWSPCCATRSMRSLLFQIAPGDLTTYLFVLGVVVIVVGAAAYLPARRAVRTDPRVLLKQE